MQLSDEFLMKWFGKDAPELSYALTPYTCIEEYQRDKELLAQNNTASAPQTKFVMVHAAKVERTDPEILGIRT